MADGETALHRPAPVPEERPASSTLSPLARVIAIALVCKVVYLAQYLDLPFLFGPLFDAHVYLLQARRILEGRFGDPTLLAFSPLYGYFLAAMGAHQGSIHPVLVQLGLGLLNVWLLHRITCRQLGATAALVAAMLYAGYGPLLCFETKIMSETVGLTLLLTTLELISRRSFASGALSTSMAAGACMALAVLARASLLPTVPLLALATWVRRDDEAPAVAGWRGPRLRRALVFALGLGMTLSAHGGWTKLHSGLFVPVILVSNTATRATQQTWTGDLAIFRGTAEQHVGAFSVVRQATERLARASRGDPEPVRGAFSLFGYLTQVPSKLWLTLRDRETSFDYGFYGERTEAWVLRLCFVSFGMLVSMGSLGLAVAWRSSKLRALAPWLAVAAGTLLTTTMFHPSTRYRLPLALALLPLTGLVWQHALALPAKRLRQAALAGLSLVGLCFALVQFVRPLENPAFWQLRVAESALEEGNFALARERIAAARALDTNDAHVTQHADRLTQRLPQRIAH